MPADDPTELFDLCDAEGRLLGVTKARGLVHRDGDWHRSVHIWVILLGERGPRVVLQRRSLTKDSHPGAVDVSVAGHLRAGETFEAGTREAEEEIGLPLAASALVRLGTRRKVARRAPSHFDRELQEVFLAVSGAPFARLRPDPDEVAGILSLSLPDAQALFDGDVGDVAAEELRAGSPGNPARVTLRRRELLQGDDDYFATALRAISRHLAGESPMPWPLDAM